MKNLLTLCALSAGLATLAQAQLTAADSSLLTQANLRGINVGVAVTFPSGNNAANRPAYDSALSQNFNTVVAENAMKFQNLSTARGVYNWGPADAIVAFAEARGMKVRGHTFVWHSQTANWFGSLTGTATSRDTTLKIMKAHIDSVAGRYKGRILEWDVVNEAIAQNGGTSPNYRTSGSAWYSRIGADFIDSAFVYAHRADSNAILFYNDFGGESMNSKGQNIYDLVSGLKQRGIPIHGVGLQAHLGNGTFDTASIGQNMRRLAALGLRISITELDIPNSGTVDSTKLAAQKQKYKSVMALCLSIPQCKTFMVWGLNDNQSWLGANTQALLFSGTATLAKKPAYFGVVEALREAGPAPLTVPGAPFGVTLSLDSANAYGGVTVTWAAPTFNGGSAITTYKAMRIPDTTKFCTSTGTLSCKISGLTPSDSVTVYVRATNAIGPGPLSPPSSKYYVPVSLARVSPLKNAGSFGRNNSYQLSESVAARTEVMTLFVSDITGRSVWQKTIRPSAAGVREISWNGTRADGRSASPGIYVLRVRTTTSGVSDEAVGKGMKLP